MVQKRSSDDSLPGNSLLDGEKQVLSTDSAELKNLDKFRIEPKDQRSPSKASATAAMVGVATLPLHTKQISLGSTASATSTLTSASTITTAISNSSSENVVVEETLSFLPVAVEEEEQQRLEIHGRTLVAGDDWLDNEEHSNSSFNDKLAKVRESSLALIDNEDNNSNISYGASHFSSSSLNLSDNSDVQLSGHQSLDCGIFDVNWRKVKIQFEDRQMDLSINVSLGDWFLGRQVTVAENKLTITFDFSSKKLVDGFSNPIIIPDGYNKCRIVLHLFGLIDVTDYKIQMMDEQIHITLKKKVPVRWNCVVKDSDQFKRKSVQDYVQRSIIESMIDDVVRPSTRKSFHEGSSDEALENLSPKHNPNFLEYNFCDYEPEIFQPKSCDTGGRRGGHQLSYPMIEQGPSNFLNDHRMLRFGHTGLDNLGNTCFMNTILQCLSNTDELRDYFLSGSFQNDVNRENPFGTGGKVSNNFNHLIQQLWSGSHFSFSPQHFKNFMGDKVNLFSDYNQQDALEYMEHFMDMLHEDVNRVDRRERIVDPPLAKREEEMTDEEFANEMWMRHRRRNNSMVIDLFHGQLKSKLVCPVCQKVSLTFDPFLYLPVPLPKDLAEYSVFFYEKCHSRKPSKITMRLPQDSKVNTLLEAIASKTHGSSAHMRAFLFKNNQIESDLSGGQIVPIFLDQDQVLSVFELYSPEKDNEEIINLVVHQRIAKPKSDTQCMTCRSEPREYILCKTCQRTIYCSKKCLEADQNYHAQRCAYRLDLVGFPFLLSIPSSQLTLQTLRERIFNCSKYSVDLTDGSLDNSSSDDTEIKIPIDSLVEETKKQEEEDQTTDCTQINYSIDGLSQTEPMDICVGSLPRSPLFIPDPLKNSIQKFKAKTTLLDSSEENSKSENSSKDMNTEDADNKSAIKHLRPKFIIGFQPELLEHPLQPDYLISEENFAKSENLCNQLKQHPYLVLDWQNGHNVKRDLVVESKDLDHSNHFYDTGRGDDSVHTLEDCLRIFTEPEILSLEDSWHCPQCKKPQEACKELTIWRLPQILVFQLKRFSFKNATREKIKKFVQFPLTGLNMKSFCSSRPNDSEDDDKSVNQTDQGVYDLFAVVNHFGGIYGGHYTASAKTCYEGNDLGWRLFDDYHVENIDEKSIVTKNAYILFYRLRQKAEPETKATIEE